MCESVAVPHYVPPLLVYGLPWRCVTLSPSRPITLAGLREPVFGANVPSFLTKRPVLSLLRALNISAG